MNVSEISSMILDLEGMQSNSIRLVKQNKQGETLVAVSDLTDENLSVLLVSVFDQDNVLKESFHTDQDAFKMRFGLCGWNTF